MTEPCCPPEVVKVVEVEVPVDKGETRNWFIPAWQIGLLHKVWSVRLAVVGAALDGVYAGVPAFQYYFPPTYFMGICIATMVAIVITRTMNQTGIDF
jgi:hypothetical protein